MRKKTELYIGYIKLVMERRGLRKKEKLMHNLANSCVFAHAQNLSVYSFRFGNVAFYLSTRTIVGRIFFYFGLKLLDFS